MQSRHNLLWWVSLSVAGLILAMHVGMNLFPFNPETRTLISDILSPSVDLLAAGALFYAAWWLKRAGHSRLALAWAVIGLAQASTALGDFFWMVFEVILHIAPYPSIADVAYLLYYPIFLVGVLLIPARREKGYEWMKTTVDMVIIILAALMIFWNYMLSPGMEYPPGEYLTLMVNLAYPIGDVLLIAALLMILYRPFGFIRSRPLWMLGLGVLVVVFYDVMFAYQVNQETYVSGTLVDSGFILGNLVFGLAGILQARQARYAEQFLQEPGNDLTGGSSSRGWLAYLPYMWVVGAYSLLVTRAQLPLPMSSFQLSLFVGLIIGLVVFRQLLALRENAALSDNLRGALDQLQRQAQELERTNHEMEIEIRERQKIEARLSYDALHDGLTGLPNRALFLDRLAQAARKRRRSHTFQYAVLFLDLDSFKVVNDSLGHVTGDQLLNRIAQMLQSCLRNTDTIARLGGDEFVILLEDFAHPDDVIHTADRLQNELRHPIELQTTRVSISVSIGIVQQVEEYEHPEDVLRDADLAMYYAKARGKARYEIFEQSMRANVISRMEIENDLRRALEEGEFILHYQPILELPDQRLVGFEALVRWQHPRRGLISPGEFIPIAEETGLILPLGKWIMHEACRQAVRWRSNSIPAGYPLKVSVNVSGKQLKQPDFVETVAEALRDTGLPAESLALEVTESVCLDSLDMVAETLAALKELGVEAQIDDFGTGYSSLSYLQRLPVRLIKIDRLFIHAMNDVNGAGPEIVRAIISMANDLGKKAVAEGIENQAQLDTLGRLHCNYVQGFLLAQPMDEAHLEKWLMANHPILQIPDKCVFSQEN